MNIDTLTIRFRNITGHEHRVEPVTRRVLALTAQRLRLSAAQAGKPMDAIAPVTIDRIAFDRAGDEEAASTIAALLTSALARGPA